jgi:hypothetical protein
VPATAPAPRPFDVDGLRRADLPLGAPFPKAGAAGQVRRLVGAKANGCMRVTLGSCSGCMKFDFGAWSRLARDRGLTLVGVTNAPPDRLAEVSRTMPDNLALVSDVGSGLTSGLHAVFTGRVFVFDRRWRLVWRSQIDGDTSLASGELAAFGRFEMERQP